MSMFSTLDVGVAYRDLRDRITGLMAGRSEAEWETIVPHCPDWTIRQTIAHLSGIVDDALNGNMSGVGTDPWTAVHVAKRQATSGPEILNEWNTYAPFVDARATEVGLQLAQLLFDATSHEHDIRFAVGVPGGRDSDSMKVATYFVAKALSEKAATQGIDGLVLLVDGVDVIAEISGPSDPSGSALVLRSTAFDLVRSFGSRRTMSQMLALDWTGDPTQFLETALPFKLPVTALDE